MRREQGRRRRIPVGGGGPGGYAPHRCDRRHHDRSLVAPSSPRRLGIARLRFPFHRRSWPITRKASQFDTAREGGPGGGPANRWAPHRARRASRIGLPDQKTRCPHRTLPRGYLTARTMGDGWSYPPETVQFSNLGAVLPQVPPYPYFVTVALTRPSPPSRAPRSVRTVPSRFLSVSLTPRAAR